MAIIPQWKTLKVIEPNGYEYFALAPDDGTRGVVIGDLESVSLVGAAIDKLRQGGQADETTHHLDERLGNEWLTVSEAARDYGVSADTVRYAARNGNIPRAEQQGNKWRFPGRTFRWWLTNEYRPQDNPSNAGSKKVISHEKLQYKGRTTYIQKLANGQYRWLWGNSGPQGYAESRESAISAAILEADSSPRPLPILLRDREPSQVTIWSKTEMLVGATVIVTKKRQHQFGNSYEPAVSVYVISPNPEAYGGYDIVNHEIVRCKTNYDSEATNLIGTKGAVYFEVDEDALETAIEMALRIAIEHRQANHA